ncbi:tRNA lysidine(34) synthetase TilS [Simiduia agarivorans]|uniref:tRNA(Ile)-lysidine synthase n=1 Tax=Simiduia agarivorans (strain DSM 21679 / JCM 13881 / BCRC 17597 / SA1) TaxID=1117647 RepID=K4KJM2_SIMAS|nr:tRNA lysidine(34) synthetase TilS [Simiduia agarivorans]AFU98198.1 mesJ protein [Simiduia agarivorans SA1 = DSM 21679]
MLLSPERLSHQLSDTSPIWLSLSGGLDSMVLLALLKQTGLPFKAIHVNHQLSANADRWADHCRHWCERFKVPLVTERVVVCSSGGGLEQAARDARYRAIAAHLEDAAQLVTAHHQDDQAETVLLRLMRGSGPTGLAAIRARQWFRKDAKGFWLIRPLLDVPRAALEGFARTNHLTWVEDESNQDTALDRNFLRSHIMPRLRDRWPTAAERLAQTAQLCGANQRLLDQLALEDGQRLMAESGERHPPAMGWQLSLDGLSALSPERRNNLLRFWLARWSLIPDRIQLDEIWRQVSGAAGDAGVKFAIGGAELRRFAGALWLLPAQLPVPTQVQCLAPGQTLPFGNGQVRLEPEAGGLALPASGAFLLRARQGGERAQPVGRRHSQTLKKLLQAQGLAPWLRDQLPLLYQDDRLAAVADLWLEQGAERAEKGWRLAWLLPQNQPPF